MDKFEAYLEAQIAEAKARFWRGDGKVDVVLDRLAGKLHALEDALAEYRKHKQDTPVFRVGQRVRHVVDKTSAEIVALGYKVKWDGQYEPSYYCYTSDQLTPIEDESEVS